MVCVGAYAPTHTIFALLFYLDLSRYEFFWIIAMASCFLQDWPGLALGSVQARASLIIRSGSVLDPFCFRL